MTLKDELVAGARSLVDHHDQIKMATVNVNRSVSDVFYRYKMPRLMAKVEGKGNGIKTVIVNMAEVAKALGRPPTYPTKYFGCELGAQTQFDFKNERFIVNGSHDAVKLQDLLDGFIRKYVPSLLFSLVYLFFWFCFFLPSWKRNRNTDHLSTLYTLLMMMMTVRI